MDKEMQGAAWRKSSYSNGSGDCVEVGVAWRKPSHSNGIGECVEVGTAPRAILIRDTTSRSAATLHVSAETWRALLVKVRAS
ncbi:MAG: hypothetical protein JWM19_7908 [Actinomycetia bacterium]|nr:hypothetical protein [Actinomycetes bacterium]